MIQASLFGPLVAANSSSARRLTNQAKRGEKLASRQKTVGVASGIFAAIGAQRYKKQASRVRPGACVGARGREESVNRKGNWRRRSA